jgi:hypothetical protein
MAHAAVSSLVFIISAGMALPQSDGESTAVPQARETLVDTSVPFAPGALEVLQDSPNVFFSSRYQAGRVGSWSYRLFPDGSALVIPDRENTAPEFVIDCPTRASCQITGSDGSQTTVSAQSTPPVAPGATDGEPLAQSLAHWILTGKHPAPTPVAIPEAPAETGSAFPARPARDASVIVPAASAQPLAAPVSTPPQESPGSIPALGQIQKQEQEQEWTPEPTAFVDPTITDPGPVRSNTAPAQTTAAPASTETSADGTPRETLAQRFRLSCSVSAAFGLRFSDADDGSDRFGKQTASFGCGLRVTERLSLRLSIVGYRFEDQKAPWDPNFTYALAYRFTDWLTLSYSSYSAQFSDPGGNVLTAFSSGSLQLSAKLPSVPIGETRTLACSTFVSVPQDYDHRFGLSCGIKATKKLTLRLTLYAYPERGQDPWDPDYVYTAAYALTDKVFIEYSNYANNRWPWNGSDSKEPGPMGGAFRVSYRLSL